MPLTGACREPRLLEATVAGNGGCQSTTVCPGGRFVLAAAGAAGNPERRAPHCRNREDAAVGGIPRRASAQPPAGKLYRADRRGRPGNRVDTGAGATACAAAVAA